MAFCKAPRFAPPVCTGPGPGTYNVTSKVAGPRYSFGPGQPRLGIVLQAQHKGQQLAATMLCCALHALRGQEAKDVDELQSEAYLLHGLKHPNIVKMVALVCLEQHVGGYLMELLGSTLAARSQSCDFGPAELLQALKCTCEGVRYLHENLVAHNDLKSSNVVKSGRSSSCFKIIDFDCARTGWVERAVWKLTKPGNHSFCKVLRISVQHVQPPKRNLNRHRSCQDFTEPKS